MSAIGYRLWAVGRFAIGYRRWVNQQTSKGGLLICFFGDLYTYCHYVFILSVKECDGTHSECCARGVPTLRSKRDT